ncbi:MAG: C4-dicarboxylate ABC transporter substrate-binding protein [Betaproteobacteria bacterium]|nr:C4-dicarboxylate ABC transporter substrate-binding protein [Betaproteobacteria bacterium]
MKKNWVSIVSLAIMALLCGAASAETILKIGYAVATNSHYGVGSTVLCEEIEKGTQGRYKCQQFPGSALGGEREMIEAVQLGTLDIVNTSTGPVGNFVPEVKIVDIPFLFRDYDHARRVLDGPIGQDILAKFPADAVGLKMRTMENKVHMDGYRAFGIAPTPMAFPEVYGALQQGTVDGQENPIPVILASKFAQVQKHLSLTGHVYSPALFITSPRVMGKLSDADKKVFYAAAVKAAAAQRKRVNDDENTGIAQLEKDGMSVVRKVDGQAFRDALREPYASYAKEFGADNIRKIQDYK